jgi:chorismate mutase
MKSPAAYLSSSRLSSLFHSGKNFHPTRKLLACLMLASVTLSTLPLTVQASENGNLPGLINERLSYMKDVASSKAENHQPVEVVAQEDRVLQDTQKVAEGLGLDPNSVKPFIVAQMSAAKAIQYRYRADWLSTPETDWKPLPDYRRGSSSVWRSSSRLMVVFHRITKPNLSPSFSKKISMRRIKFYCLKHLSKYV